MDTSWEDVYDNVRASTSTLPASEQTDFEFQRPVSETLRQHLLGQIDLERFSDRDSAIAMAVVDSINDHGYLASPVSDIHQGLLGQLEELEFDEVEAVLHRVQNFDPLGVGALDLMDCLLIQLNHLPDETPWKEEARSLVSDSLEHLAAQNQIKLKRDLGLSDEELSQVVLLVRSLDPRPGTRVENNDSQYVTPDVFVTKKNGNWLVALNPDTAPKLRVNPFYSGLIKRADNSADNTCMKITCKRLNGF